MEVQWDDLGTVSSNFLGHDNPQSIGSWYKGTDGLKMTLKRENVEKSETHLWLLNRKNIKFTDLIVSRNTLFVDFFV